MGDTHLLGQTCALLAAFTWACALVLFKRSSDDVEPIALNLFKNAIGIALLAATVALQALLMDEDPGWGDLSDIVVLSASGIIGIAVADTLFFYALRRIGVGLISIVDCVYAPLVILFSWLLLSEQLRWQHWVGGALVLAGLLVASGHEPPAGRSRREVLTGMVLAMLSVGTMALGIVAAKPVLHDYDTLRATFVRIVAGTASLALLTPVLPGRLASWRVFLPSPVWRRALPAAVLGTYLAMLFWVAGFKYTDASVAAILNQTTTLFALVLATLYLRERFTRRKLAAVVLGVAGVLLVVSAGATAG